MVELKNDLWAFDRQFLSEKVKVLAGADEAGRGPLAGPLVAAAVILKKRAEIPGLTDSKKLTPCKREIIYDIILHNVMCLSIVSISPWEIDNKGLQKMNLAALEKAISRLEAVPDLALVDGFQVDSERQCHKLVKGDSKSASIAAASIVAKVTRDRLMMKMDEKYPSYGFAAHLGYATEEHLEKLSIHGPSPIHRRSFSRVGR